MAHLDFREALSTPEQKILAVPAAVAVAQPQLPPIDSYFPEIGLSRSAWANIVFVAIAAIGGMACAFYFFNGAEVLRTAAAWPAEFLYPRPPLTELAQANVLPNPVDQYTSDSTSAARKNGDAQDLADQTFRPTQLAQFPASTNSFASTPTTPTNIPAAGPPIVPVVPPGLTPVVPPVGQPIIPPVIPPVVPPGIPQPDSILGEVQKLVAGADTVGQSVYQTVSSLKPKKVSTLSARGTIGSARKKVVNTRQNVSARSIPATSTSRMQQLTPQLPSSTVQNQTMFGGGMGTVSGIGSAGSVGSAGGTGTSSPGVSGVSGVGTPGGVTGPSGVGSLPGVGTVPGVGGVGGIGPVSGLPGVGGISGGLPGIGGVLGGHH